MGDPDDIFHDWDRYSAEDYTLIKKLYNEAIKKIVDDNGGFPECKLSNLPNYRTSKVNIIKKIPKTNAMQMVPKIPPNLLQESTGKAFE